MKSRKTEKTSSACCRPRLVKRDAMGGRLVWCSECGAWHRQLRTRCDSPTKQDGEFPLSATHCSRSLSEWSKRELLALPHREWDATEEEYDSLLIFPTGRKHESGWKGMAIVGCRNMIPVEICSSCSDDIEWKLPTMKTFGQRKEWSIGQMRMDCTPEAGILHAWCRDGKFRVGCAISSITVDLISSENPTSDASPGKTPI